jgi:hypothetical protein
MKTRAGARVCRHVRAPVARMAEGPVSAFGVISRKRGRSTSCPRNGVEYGWWIEPGLGLGVRETVNSRFSLLISDNER